MDLLGVRSAFRPTPTGVARADDLAGRSAFRTTTVPGACSLRDAQRLTRILLHDDVREIAHDNAKSFEIGERNRSNQRAVSSSVEVLTGRSFAEVENLD